MRFDRGLFRDPATMTFPTRLPERSTLSDPDRYLPPKVAEVTREVIKNFPHSKRVGNYLLGKTLGEGSFAKVKESLHILTGEKVAIKVIDKKKAKEDAYVRKNMRREGKLLQIARHRHVVQLYEIMETENSYYLVTELCRGGDLMDHICAKKRLEERETRRHIRAVISAVHYLHTAGILHRDIKIENLLLDEHKEIKIIDFGLSNAIRISHTKDGHSVAQEFCVTQCGSPAYAAPELLGNKKYGPKVDVWSIGVNMYAMLTGNLPFTVEPFNIKQLHQKMLKGDMNPIPDTLSRNGKDFLKQLLTPDPEERISLLEAMKHPWITEGKSSPMEPAPFPNKLNADDLDNNILQHMSQNLDYRLSEAIRLVTNNIPSNATSTYHMFRRKLNRYNAEMRVQGKVAAAEAQLISSSRSTQNTSGYVSRDDVIDQTHTAQKETTHARDVTTEVNNNNKEDTESSETQKFQNGVQTPGSSPVKILHHRHLQTKTRQRTFHGNEKPPNIHHGIHSNSEQLPDTSGNRDTSSKKGDMEIFSFANENPSKKPVGTSRLWATPQTGRILSTHETPTGATDDGQHRHQSGQSELPAIAEKTISDTSPEPPKKTPKSCRSPRVVRRMSCDFKPVSNYTFRSRDSARDVIRKGNYSFRPRGPFTDAFGQGNSKPGSRESDEKVETNQSLMTPDSVLDRNSRNRRNDTDNKLSSSHRSSSKPNRRQSVNVKIHPRKVLIDVAHYEKYSRKHPDGSTSPVPNLENRASTISPDRHIFSTMYPVHKFNRPNRNFQMYTRNRLSIRDGDLNVTGERTGVNGSRVQTVTRDSLSCDHKTMRKDENHNITDFQMKYSDDTMAPLKVNDLTQETQSEAINLPDIVSPHTNNGNLR